MLVMPLLAICDECGAQEQVLAPIPPLPMAQVQFFTLPGEPSPPGWKYVPRTPEMTLPHGYNGKALICPNCVKEREPKPVLRAVK